jgi:hypothetical protein
VIAPAENAERLLELERNLDELARLKKENPLYFFRANDPQKRMFGSDATYRSLFGGNKVGKTTWGKIEAISYCLGCRPFLPKDHPRYLTPFKPPIKGMSFCETWDKADEVTTPHYQKWLPKGAADPIRRHGRTVGWQFKNGSEVRYATYEMDPDRMEGADKHFYDFDEPPPYGLWTPITRGVVVTGGKIWLTLTLLSEGWIWDEIWEKHEAGDPDYYATTGDIRDNLAKENSDGTTTGALSEEAIVRFEKTLDDVQKEVRLHGKPQHLQGRIFKHFAVKEPWVTPEYDTPKEWPTIRAIDPHLGKPDAVVWAKVTPSNRIVVTDCLFDPTIQNLKELKDRMDAIERKRHHKVVMSLMDSSFNVKDVNGESMIDVYRKAGIECRPAPKADKRARLMATAEMFKLDQDFGQPFIVMFDTVKHLIWEIRRYVHPSLRQKKRGEAFKEYPDTKDKKDDDCIDCLLYLVSQKPNYRALKSGYHTYRGFDDEASHRSNRTVNFAEPYGNGAVESHGGY